MALYQIYWNDCYEGETGRILSHTKEYTQKEFDEIVQEARHQIGGYKTLLHDIEDYMAEYYGFVIEKYMRSHT